jgi:hypothetical protein
MYPGYFEETEDCSFRRPTMKPIPFKIKYLWSKDPCETCLVRACCLQKYLTQGSPAIICDEKRTYTDGKKSLRNLPSKFSTPAALAAQIIIWLLLFAFLCSHIWI